MKKLTLTLAILFAVVLSSYGQNVNATIVNQAVKSISVSLEESRLVVAGRAKLYSVDGYNSSAAVIWVMFIDSATIPADGTITALLYPSVRVPAGGSFSRVFSPPIQAVNGIVMTNSQAASTAPFTKQVTGAICVYAAQYTTP